MKLRQLGVNGPKVHPVGVGAMSFSDFYGPTDEAESHAILHAAYEAGVTHLDTANVYGMGRSEQAIGSFLAAHPFARRHFSIATKASITRDPDGRRYYDNSFNHLQEELEASLTRLGVEAVDLFYVHRRDQDVPIEEVAGNLGRIVESGKAKAVGFSEIAPGSLRRAQKEFPVAAVQSEYSLSTRSPEMGLVQACAELGVALVAFSPVGRSLLTDHPIPYETCQSLGFMKNNPRFMQPNYGFNLAATDRLRLLGEAMGEPAAALAIAWLLARGEHVIPIPGTRSTAHFAELLRGAELSLGAGELAAIEDVLPIGWAHGDRYNEGQWNGPERYC